MIRLRDLFESSLEVIMELLRKDTPLSTSRKKSLRDMCENDFEREIPLPETACIPNVMESVGCGAMTVPLSSLLRCSSSPLLRLPSSQDTKSGVFQNFKNTKKG